MLKVLGHPRLHDLRVDVLNGGVHVGRHVAHDVVSSGVAEILQAFYEDVYHKDPKEDSKTRSV